MDLAALGWDEHWAETLARNPAGGSSPARVVNEDKNAYVVVGEAGEYPATISGRLHHLKRNNAQLPKVGDWVTLKPPTAQSAAVIQTVLSRRTQVLRQGTGRATTAQVLVANVDLVFLVQALDPSFNARRLERFLVMVRQGGAQPVVLLNKVDLTDHVAERTQEARAAAGDAPVLITSAKTGKGFGELRALLVPRQTVCFLGTSGVGKSSLINRLYGEKVQDTVPVREDDSKGRHTTTRREILPLPNGTLVVDTPGMREFHLWLADTGLADSFPELTALAAHCRFRDCTHGAEPGCAVKAAVAGQTVPADRYESFRKLQAELLETGQRRLARDHAANRRRARTGTKAYFSLERETGENAEG